MANFTASVKIIAVSNLSKIAKKASKATAKMRKGFEKLSKSVKKSSAGFARFAKRASLGAGIVGIAFLAMLKKVANLGDTIDKTSQKTGILADDLQKLQFAARIGGASSTDLNKALKFLARGLSEAGDGVAEYKDEYDKMGIAVFDAAGNLREPKGILLEMADAFSVASDGGWKTARAVTMLGRAGEALIPMLNLGAEGIEALGEDVDFAITDEMADVGANFNDMLEKLKTNMMGLTQHALTPALLILTPFIDKMNDGLIPLNKWIEESVDFEKVLESISDWVKKLDLKEAFDVSVDGIKGVVDDLGAIIEGMREIVDFVSGATIKRAVSEIAVPVSPQGKDAALAHFSQRMRDINRSGETLMKQAVVGGVSDLKSWWTNGGVTNQTITADRNKLDVNISLNQDGDVTRVTGVSDDSNITLRTLGNMLPSF